jgi:hypothetical protein
MNKLYTCIACAAIATLLCFLPAISQEDVMTIGGPDAFYGFTDPQRPVVMFTHTQHMDLEMIDGSCLPCHHDGRDEEGNFTEGDMVPCKDCHDEAAKGEMSLLNAYHKQCIDCHEQAEAGPITCGECHVKTEFYGMPLGNDKNQGESQE